MAVCHLPATVLTDSHYFIENKGQWDAQALFLARASGLDVWLTHTGLIYDLYSGTSSLEKNADRKGTIVRMNFLHSSGKSDGEGLNKLPSFHGYMHEGHFISDVGLFSRTHIRQIYPGIDIVYYFDNGMPRYDLHVQPGASASQIALCFEGMEHIALNGEKTLVIQTPTGTIKQQGLFAYQDIDGHRTQVECSFVLNETNSQQPVIHFALGAYDTHQPLVIDPFIYSTYLGGNAQDYAYDIATDAAGYAYVTGKTYSADFPVGTGAHYGHDCDGFVTKLSPNGTSIVYSIFVGEGGYEHSCGIAVDHNGNAYIAGQTASVSFSSDHNYLTDKTLSDNDADAFIFKVSTDGTVSYLARIGGKSDDIAQDIALDSAGNIYITGTTKSPNFPGVSSSIPTLNNEDVFFCVLSQDGTLLNSMVVGGTGHDYGTALAFDKKGYVYVVGSTEEPGFWSDIRMGYGGKTDAFLIRYDITTQNIWSAIFGGSEKDGATAVTVDTAGNVYIAGYTESFDLEATFNAYQQTLRGKMDAFFAQFDPFGTLNFLSYLGGREDDIANGISISPSGSIVLAGTTKSPDLLPFTPMPDLPAGKNKDGFIMSIQPVTQRPVYGTYIGAAGDDEITALAAGNDGSIYITGITQSSNFPVLKPLYNPGSSAMLPDAFVSCIRYLPQPIPNAMMMDFGEVLVPMIKDSSITITNSGTTPFIIRGATLDKQDDFLTPPFQPFEVQPGSNASIALRFAPHENDADSSELRVRISGRGMCEDSIIRIPVRGKGIKKDLDVQVFPNQVDFDRIRTNASLDHNQSFKDTTLWIISDEKEAVEITGADITGDPGFSVITPLPVTIVPHGNQPIIVRFMPPFPGIGYATLHLHFFESNNFEVPIPLMGTGVRPIPQAAAVDFGAVAVQQSKDSLLILHNPHPFPIEITNAHVDNPQNFSIDFTTNIIIAPGRNDSLPVRFAPQSEGNFFSYLYLKIEGIDAEQIASLYGNGALPTLTIQSIQNDTLQFDSVQVHTRKRNTVTLVNTGSIPVQIIKVELTKATDFTIFPPPFPPLAPGASIVIPVEFAPASEGMKIDQLHVTLAGNNKPLECWISGIGFIPNITISADTLNFGTVEVAGSKRDSILLSNTYATIGVTIKDLSSIFILENKPDSLPHGITPLYIKFHPDNEGSYIDSLTLETEKSLRTIYCKGVGKKSDQPDINAKVFIPSLLEAKVSEVFRLPIILENYETTAPLLQKAQAAGFSATIRYNSTVLTTVDPSLQGPVESGMRSMTVTGTWQQDSTLIEIPVKALLGDAEYTVLELTNFVWLNSQGSPLNGQTAKGSGKLHITGIWYDNGVPRLINPYAGSLVLQISPNPFSGETTLHIGNITPNATLKIYDILGNSILDLSNGLLTSTTVSLKRSDLPGVGMYYCRLTSGEYSLTRVLIVSP